MSVTTPSWGGRTLSDITYVVYFWIICYPLRRHLSLGRFAVSASGWIRAAPIGDVGVSSAAVGSWCPRLLTGCRRGVMAAGWGRWSRAWSCVAEGGER